MSQSEIEAFLKKNPGYKESEYEFQLKGRNPISGFLIEVGDHQFLRSKNFWRIVSRENKESWVRTRNMELLVIISGDAFIRIRPAG